MTAPTPAREQLVTYILKEGGLSIHVFTDHELELKLKTPIHIEHIDWFVSDDGRPSISPLKIEFISVVLNEQCSKPVYTIFLKSYNPWIKECIPVYVPDIGYGSSLGYIDDYSTLEEVVEEFRRLKKLAALGTITPDHLLHIHKNYSRKRV